MFKSWIRWLLAACFCATVTPVFAQDAATAAPPLEPRNLETWLDGIIPYGLERGDIGGAIVLVVKDGQILFSKGYGYADVAAKIPMDPAKTKFGVGSVSKLFTWTAVMQQVEQGKLDLDRDVNDYLDFKIPATYPQPITLRHLMTHTAGFAERAFRTPPAGTDPRPLGPYMRAMPAPDRIYPPGVIPAYSNYGAMLAGYIVERVSGEPFIDYVAGHILRPLSMSNSTFRRPATDPFWDALAKSYNLASGSPEPANREEPAGDPSGHLTSTAEDLAHFILAHLQLGQFGEQRILAPATAETMHSTAFQFTPGLQGVDLGFVEASRNGHRVIGHPGDISAFHADVELLPAEGVGFFFLINSDGAPQGVLSAGHGLRAYLFHRFMDRYFPGPARTEEPTLPTAKEHGQAAAGEYRMSRRYAGNFMEAVSILAQYFVVHLRIDVNDDGTIETPGFLDFEQGRPRRWREVAPFVWQEVNGTARIYTKQQDGRVSAFYPDDLIAVWMNERAPYRASVCVPLLLASIVVMLFVLGGWLVQSLRRQVRALENRELHLAQRWRRRAALLAVLHLLGWTILLGAAVPEMLGQEFWIRVVQLIGVFATVAAAISVWRTVAASGAGPWLGRVGSLIVVLALTDLVWFSFAFHLLSVRLNY